MSVSVHNNGLVKRTYREWLASSASTKGLIILLALLLLVSVGWLITVKREEARQITFVIPPGTSRQIERGQAGVNFPDEIILTLGLWDTIIIENQDNVIHNFGPFVVGPQATLTKRFDVPITYEGACSFHQEQQMRLVVNPAPWDIFN